jgi:hypothetical protein
VARTVLSVQVRIHALAKQFVTGLGLEALSGRHQFSGPVRALMPVGALMDVSRQVFDSGEMKGWVLRNNYPSPGGRLPDRLFFALFDSGEGGTPKKHEVQMVITGS